MKTILFFFGALVFTFSCHCQVGIGTTTPSPAAMLEVKSTLDGGTPYLGFMPPRIPNVNARNSITVNGTDAGLIIYLSSSGCLQLWTGTDWENIKCNSVPPNPPTLLGTQNFEIVPAIPNLPVSDTLSYLFTSGLADYPAGSPMCVSPSRGYGGFDFSNIITFGPVDASLYTFVIITFHLAAFAKVGDQGADSDDLILLSVSTDGITYKEEIKILGYSNSKWGFDNPLVASSLYDGDGIPTIFQSRGTYASGIGLVELKNIPSSSNISFKIQMTNDRSDEIWVIDDVKVYGI